MLRERPRHLGGDPLQGDGGRNVPGHVLLRPLLQAHVRERGADLFQLPAGGGRGCPGPLGELHDLFPLRRKGSRELSGRRLPWIAARQRPRQQRGHPERAPAVVSLAAEDHVRPGWVLGLDQGGERARGTDGQQDVGFRERAGLALQHQRSARPRGRQQRDGKECRVTLFGELREVLELLGETSVVDGHRAHRLYAGAGDPLADLHAHFAEGVPGESKSAAQHQLIAGFEHVHRSDGRCGHRRELLAEIAKPGGEGTSRRRPGSKLQCCLDAVRPIDDLHGHSRRIHKREE